MLICAFREAITCGIYESQTVSVGWTNERRKLRTFLLRRLTKPLELDLYGRTVHFYIWNCLQRASRIWLTNSVPLSENRILRMVKGQIMLLTMARTTVKTDVSWSRTKIENLEKIFNYNKQVSVTIFNKMQWKHMYGDPWHGVSGRESTFHDELHSCQSVMPLTHVAGSCGGINVFLYCDEGVLHSVRASPRAIFLFL